MKTININLEFADSYIISDAVENFVCTKAYKNLVSYSQKYNNYVSLFNSVTDVINCDYYEEWELEKLYYIVSIEARGDSQWNYQEFTFYFRKEAETDKEMVNEINYLLETLQYYFSETWINAFWEIEDIIIIHWKEYKNTEDFDNSFTESFRKYPSNDQLKDFILNEFIPSEWYSTDEFTINIDYNII